MKEGIKSSPSGVSRVIGKYTYYRKKLSRKEFGSALCVATDNSGQRLPEGNQRKQFLRDANDTKKVETVAVRSGKARSVKKQKDSSAATDSYPVIVKSSLHSDQSCLKSSSSRKASKLSRTVQSMPFSYFGGCWFYNDKFSAKIILVVLRYIDDVERAVKPNGKKLSVFTENRTVMNKVVSSNNHDGAIQGKSSPHCSKNILSGEFAFVKICPVWLNPTFISYLFCLNLPDK